MTLSFPRFSWLWRKRKDKEQVSSNSSLNPQNPSTGWGLGYREEPESLKFPSVKRVNNDRKVPSSSIKPRSKGNSIDKEYDAVLVPSDGVSLSGSESDGPEWSIGWPEYHAPGFISNDDNADDESFGVLVPSYRHRCQKSQENVEVPAVEFLSSAENLPSSNFYGGREYVDQWLSSLKNF